MKKLNSWTGLLMLLFLLLLACTNDKLPEPQTGGCDPALVYDGAIKPIINNSCALSGCHDASGGGPGNFLTYEGMLGSLNNGAIETRVVVQRDMPIPPGELSAEDLETIRCWLDAGFPEN
ncbi:MAG: hypothetical protein AAF985_01520 [Bacteroidota bacterium]